MQFGTNLRDSSESVDFPLCRAAELKSFRGIRLELYQYHNLCGMW